MVLLYHGTNLGSAIKIAERGAILSQLQRLVETRRIMFPNCSEEWIKEAAEQTTREMYSERDWQDRACSVYVAINRFYAWPNAGPRDVVLGVELAEEELKKRVPEYENFVILPIPERLDLDGLKEVWLSTYAQLRKKELQKSFARYNYGSFLLEEE